MSARQIRKRNSMGRRRIVRHRRRWRKRSQPHEDGRYSADGRYCDVSLRHEAAALHSSTHDGLTDLPNRVLLRARLDEALRDTSSPVALLVLDLDRFKEVNDTLGHQIGDSLLQQV